MSSGNEMWMLLIVRMITRVADPEPSSSQNEDEAKEEDKIVGFYSRQDKLRQTLCDYIMVDFPSRYVISSFQPILFSDSLICWT